MRRLRPEFAACASEFVGTFYLALTVILGVLQKAPLAPVAIGFMLAAMTFASGPASDAHFNPAVTAGVALSGRGVMDPRRAVFYIVAQCFGGLTASWLAWLLLGATFTLEPGEGYTFCDAFIVELVFSGALAFVVLNTSTLTKGSRAGVQAQFGGLAVGLTLLAAAFAVGPVSGCSLNPAVACGVMFAHAARFEGFATHCDRRLFALYFFVPILGGMLAAGVFRVVREAEFDEEVPIKDDVQKQGQADGLAIRQGP